MQLTHCRLFCAAYGWFATYKKALQPLCSRIWFQLQHRHRHTHTHANAHAYAHIRTHMHTRACPFVYGHGAGYRHRIRCSHALSTGPTLSAPSYATPRDRISICCTYMYVTVRKSTRIVPLDQQSVFDGSYPPLLPPLPWHTFFYDISSSNCRVVCRAIMRQVKFIDPIHR